MKIGKYTVTEINTASFGLDGGAMFGIVPKPLWEKSSPSDDKNRIALQTRCLLLESDSKKILIETGIGSGWDYKFRNIYKIEDETFDVSAGLKEKGIKPDEITDVILTHLHFDHTGGSVKNVNGKYEPAFPNAEYYAQKSQYEWASSPSQKDAKSFVQERFQPLFDEGVLTLLDGEQDFDDEIELLTFEGHTFGQQLVKLKDSSIYLYSADLFPTVAHVSPVYNMSFDNQPLVTVKEKKEILSIAAENEWKLIMGHDVNTAMVTVTKNNGNFEIKEKFGKLD